MVSCGYSSCVVEQLSVFQISKMDQERLWLGLPLAMVPVDTLPSEKTVLRALYGIFNNNMKKYRENSEKIGCLLLKDTSNPRCEVEKGCRKTPTPCLLYRVTETAVIFCFSNIVKSAKEALYRKCRY